MDLDEAFSPPEPITWPGGGEQPVKWISWRQESLISKLPGASPEQMEEIMEKVMPAILPGRTWDEIQDTLDSEMMEKLVVYASRRYKKAREELESTTGNGAAGTSPPSAPPTPAPTSSVESLPATAAPCGT
jgi:hypothetical protein